jgi:hypothetical protein
MKRAGITDGAVLEELASHLRDQTKQYVAGMDAESAFALAVESLGEPAAMRREFAKQRRGIWAPVVIIASLWVILNVAISGGLLRNRGMIFDGREIVDLLRRGGPQALSDHMLQSKIYLSINIISAIAGISAVYASGILAMLYVWSRWKEKILELRERALVRAIEIFNGLIAVLTAVTILGGMLWIKQGTGSFFPEHLPVTMATWAAVTASVVMLLWFAAIFLSRRFWKANPSLLMMLQFGGNLVVLLSPFCVYVHMHPSWWIDILIALNVIFLSLAMTIKKAERLIPV